MARLEIDVAARLRQRFQSTGQTSNMQRIGEGTDPAKRRSPRQHARVVRELVTSMAVSGSCTTVSRRPESVSLRPDSSGLTHANIGI